MGFFMHGISAIQLNVIAECFILFIFQSVCIRNDLIDSTQK